MILYRCFAWNERARPGQPDAPLWFPRVFQGDGRHDNPDAYGCLYLTDREPSGVVEQLARFRGQRLIEQMLVRRGLPLAIAAIELPDDTELVDLDDPVVLRRRRLRPSLVATRQRLITQPQALAVYRDTEAAGIRWWSIFESLWANYTIFDRAVRRLRLEYVRPLSLDDTAVIEAADYLGLPSGTVPHAARLVRGQ